jgi:hypothetical protein
VVSRLRPWDPDGTRLESFAPSGFETYARIFHPTGFRPAFAGALDPSDGVRWATLGAERGVGLSADVAFCEVVELGPDGYTANDLEPAEGCLPPDTCRAIGEILRSHTTTPDTCWFCLWDGNGAFWSTAHSPLFPDDASAAEVERYVADARAQDDLLHATPMVETRHRSYFLFRGPLDAASAFEVAHWYLSPNIWWPDDRAWIVVTEVDGYSTYLGGTHAAIEDVLASTDLEAIEVPLDVHMDPGPYRPRWREAKS